MVGILKEITLPCGLLSFVIFYLFRDFCFSCCFAMTLCLNLAISGLSQISTGISKMIDLIFSSANYLPVMLKVEFLRSRQMVFLNYMKRVHPLSHRLLWIIIVYKLSSMMYQRLTHYFWQSRHRNACEEDLVVMPMEFKPQSINTIERLESFINEREVYRSSFRRIVYILRFQGNEIGLLCIRIRLLTHV